MYMQVPRYLTFLPHEGEVQPSLSVWPQGAMAAVLDVDNTDMARVAGAEMNTFEGEVVNIDHHGTNRREAAVSLVDPSQAAAAMIVKDVVDALGVPWSGEIATPLLLGTNTDTGSFRFANTTPQVLRTAADLVEHGADLSLDQRSAGPQSAALLRPAARGPGPDGLFQ